MCSLKNFNKNKYLQYLFAVCLIAMATLVAPLQNLAQAQNTVSPDALSAEALTAFKKKNHPRAITLLQERLRILINLHGEKSPQVTAANEDLAHVQDEYADALYEAGKYQEALALYRQVLAERERRTGRDSADTGTSLSDVAKSLAALRQYAEALPLHQRALAIAEKVHGPESTDTGIILIDLGQLYRSMGRNSEALPLLRRALAISEKTYGSTHTNTGSVLNTLAESYRTAGMYADALPLYRRSLAIAEKAQGSGHVSAGVRMNNLGLLYESMGLYEEALPLFVRALAIMEKTNGPAHASTSVAVSSLAGVYKSMGKYAEALPLYKRALAITEKAESPNHPTTAIWLSNLADLYERMGLYAEALPLLRRALAIAEKAQGPEHPDTGLHLNNLAGLYENFGQYAEALPLYRRALAISEKVNGPEHPHTSRSLNNLGFVYNALGRIGEALPLYQKALAISEKVEGADHPSTGIKLNNLATLYLEMGRHKEALPLYQRALAIAEKTEGPEHPSTGTSLRNLAGLYEVMGQHAAALPLYQRALLIANNAGTPELAWKVQDSLRATYDTTKQPDLAIFFGKQAVNTLQGMRAGLSKLDRELQRSFLTNKTFVYRELADLLIQQGRLAEAQHVLGMLKEEEFFDFVRRTEGDDPRQRRIAVQPHEQPWHERLSALTVRAGKAAAARAELERKAKLGLTAAEKTRLAELNREKEAITAELQRFYAEAATAFAAAKGQRENAADAVAQLKTTQQTLSALGAGSVLVQYVLSENRLNIILTTASGQTAKSAAIAQKDLNQKIESFRVALRNPAVSVLPAAQELYKLLISPVEQELAAAGARTLMFSLDGALRYIPVSALHNGKQYLIERYDLSLYTEVTRSNLAHRPAGNMSIAGLGLTRQIGEFSPLPAVKAELSSIVRVGNQGLIKGELHFDEQFNIGNIRLALQHKHPLIHLASHFVFRPGNESTSFLLLGDGDRLTLSRIRQEKLNFSHVDLVTLSACETGVGGGRTAQGEEVEGLGALIQKQGAKGVIATLWPVADESTGLLMQNFYRLREEKKLSKADALRQAQLMLVKGQVAQGSSSAQRGLDAPASAAPRPAATYAHPYYWAPFILMGNWL